MKEVESFQGWKRLNPGKTLVSDSASTALLGFGLTSLIRTALESKNNPGTASFPCSACFGGWCRKTFEENSQRMMSKV